MSKLSTVPSSDRTLSTWDVFLLWAGAAVSLSEIWAGGLLLPLGLAKGLLVIVLGHVIGNIPMALMGVIGTRHGVPAIVSTRAALGIRGSYLPAVLNIVQLVGWTAVMLWIGGHAAATVAVHTSLGARFWIAALGLLTTAWALGGHRIWKWLQRLGVVLLLLLSAWMTARAVGAYGTGILAKPPPSATLPFMLGLDIVIAMPVSWIPLVSDYSRHAAGTRGAFWGTLWGYALASSWMYAAGLLTSIATGSGAPDAILLEMMRAGGLAIPALLIVLLSTFTTTFLDIYSNAVSIRSLLPRANERLLVAASGLAGTAIAVASSSTGYESFLLFIGSAFCPLAGVVLADYFLVRRGDYDGPSLFGGRRYWYRGGVHPAGLLAWLGGFAAYHACAHSPVPVGSSLPAMIAAAAAYLALKRPARRNEAP